MENLDSNFNKRTSVTNLDESCEEELDFVEKHKSIPCTITFENYKKEEEITKIMEENIVNYKDLPDDYCIFSRNENRVIELELCPFCGNRAFLNSSYTSIFGWCSVYGAQGAKCYDHKEAINKWNNRAPLKSEKNYECTDKSEYCEYVNCSKMEEEK